MVIIFFAKKKKKKKHNFKYGILLTIFFFFVWNKPKWKTFLNLYNQLKFFKKGNK